MPERFFVKLAKGNPPKNATVRYEMGLSAYGITCMGRASGFHCQDRSGKDHDAFRFS